MLGIENYVNTHIHLADAPSYTLRPGSLRIGNPRSVNNYPHTGLQTGSIKEPPSTCYPSSVATMLVRQLLLSSSPYTPSYSSKAHSA